MGWELWRVFIKYAKAREEQIGEGLLPGRAQEVEGVRGGGPRTGPQARRQQSRPHRTPASTQLTLLAPLPPACVPLLPLAQIYREEEKCLVIGAEMISGV